MMNKKCIWVFCLLCLLCLFSNIAQSQEQTSLLDTKITLRVRGTREPIEGALITVSCGDVEAERELLTDAFGEVSFGFWSGCGLVIDAPGYQAVPEQIWEAREGLGAVEIFLTPVSDDSLSDAFYTVAAVASPQGGTSRRLEDVSVLAGVRNDPLQGLQALPGLGRTGFGAGLLLVRGGVPQDTRVWLDDVPLPLAVHLGGARTIIPSDSVESVELFASNYPIRFGGALGGVVELRQRGPSLGLHHGSASVDFVEVGGAVEGPLARSVQYAVTGRRSYLEVLTPLLAEVSDLESYTLPFYWDSQARIYWQLSKHHELRVMGLAVGDRMAIISEEDQEDSLEMESQIYRVALSHHYQASQLKHRMTWSFGTDMQDVKDTYNHYLRDGWRLNGRERAEWQVLDGLMLEVGAEIQGRDQPITFGPGKGGAWREEIWDRGLMWEGGEFLSVTLADGEWASVTVGGRRSYNTFVNESAFDGRLWLTFQPWDILALSFSAGTVSQAPSHVEVERMGRGSLGQLYNIQPQWQRGVQVAMGVTLQSSAYAPLSLSWVGYMHGLNQLAVDRDYTSLLGEPAEDGLDRPGYRGEWQARGAELLLKYEEADGFEGWVSYGLMQVDGRRSATHDWGRGAYEQLQSLTLVGVFHLPEQWRIATKFGFSMGAPYSPNSTSLFETEYFQRFQSPVDVEPFHRLDIRADKTWLFDLWTLSLYLDVQGAYYHSNVELVTGSRAENTKTYGLPILPSFGVKGAY